MTDTSNYQYIETTGVIVPDTEDILTGVQQEYKDAFQNQNLIVTPDTPQGVLITTDALARTQEVNNNAAVANQINPNLSGGVFFDAIWALTGGQRTAQSRTQVPNCPLTGVANTIIPALSQARTVAGDLFQLTSTVVLDANGDGVGQFESVAFGPVPAAQNTMTFIVSNSVLGWETVNNPNPATLGKTTQSDAAGKASRNNTLALNGVSLAEAITSALYATDSVQSLSFRENYNDDPQGLITMVTGGTTLAGTVWGMTNTGGSATNGGIIVGTDPIDFAETGQTVPPINPWPTAAFATTANITLSGLATQGGGDWPATLTAGQIILVKNQTSDINNGLYQAQSGAWTRQAYMATGNILLGANDGISLIPHSVYACVNGGTDVDVAAALLENKSSGASWNGGTSVNVVEPASGQTYNVLFDRPTQVPILIKITVKGGTADQVTQAILDYAAGNIENETGFVVGGAVSPFELAGAVNEEFPQIYVKDCQITLASNPTGFAPMEIPIALNEIPQTQLSYITVIVVS